MKIFTVVLLSIILMNFASCRSMMQKSSETSSLAFSELAKSGYCGVQKSEQKIVRDSESLKNLWQQIYSIYHPIPDLPEIDFDKKLVLGVFMGTVSTGGYAIEIICVSENPKQLIVEYKLTVPAPDDFVTMALSQPFHLISMAQSSKEIIFKLSKDGD